MSMRVSVVIPAYNAERHLEEAVRSVLAQTYADFELLIINDGSQDGTLEIINRLASEDSRIRVISQENRGMGEALNRAMQETEADWVVRMDADDRMLPQRIERQLAFLQENPDVCVSACLAQYISEQGKISGHNCSDLLTRENFNNYRQKAEAIGLLHPGVIMHRATVLTAGGYRGRFWPADDIDLWNRLAEQGHLILVQPEVLMCYRIHDGSVSTARFAATRLKYEWVRACMRARRNHQSEPDWETFLQQWQSVSMLRKVDRWRKTSAKACYHAAGHDWLTQRYPASIVRILGALLLQPEYALVRLAKQVLR